VKNIDQVVLTDVPKANLLEVKIERRAFRNSGGIHTYAYARFQGKNHLHLADAREGPQGSRVHVHRYAKRFKELSDIA